MVEPGPSSVILWDTLKLSAEPLRGRSNILVLAQVEVRKAGQQGSDTYRISFEINRHHGLVSHDVEVWVWPTGGDVPLWRYSGWRDIVVAVKHRFLTTQLYAHVAGQLGWIPDAPVRLTHAPLDP
jgi:hypothetical protein